MEMSAEQLRAMQERARAPPPESYSDDSSVQILDNKVFIVRDQYVHADDEGNNEDIAIEEANDDENDEEVDAQKKKEIDAANDKETGAEEADEEINDEDAVEEQAEKLIDSDNNDEEIGFEEIIEKEAKKRNDEANNEEEIAPTCSNDEEFNPNEVIEEEAEEVNDEAPVKVIEELSETKKGRAEQVISKRSSTRQKTLYDSADTDEDEDKVR